MTCKDCNDTGKYQPLTGPSEPCQSCKGCPLSHDIDINAQPPEIDNKVIAGIDVAKTTHYAITMGRIPLDQLKLRPIHCTYKADRIGREVNRLIKGNMSPIVINENYVVLLRPIQLVALRKIQKGMPKKFEDICPGGLVSVSLKTILDCDLLISPQDEETEPIDPKAPQIRTLNRAMHWLQGHIKATRYILKAEMPPYWSLDKQMKWMSLRGDANMLTHTIKRMADRMEEL